MTASQLLKTIEARGGKVAVAAGADGAAKLQIAPRGLVPDLAGEIGRLKPELLELLTAPLKGTGVARSRWRETSPDIRAMADELEAARRGAWVVPLPSLLARWRELQAFTGAKITARHLSAGARLIERYPDLDNGELLELWAAGLRPDKGDGAAVWSEPDRRAISDYSKARAGGRESGDT